MPTKARNYVPAAPYAPAPYSLLTAVDQVLDGDVHSMAGIDYQPEPCDPARTTLEYCQAQPTPIPSKAPTVTGVDSLSAEPFTVFAVIECAPVGNYDDFDRRAIAALTNGEARAVETTFWTGVAQGGTVYPHLAANADVFDTATVTLNQLQMAATVVTGSPTSIVRALGALEGALGTCYGGEGIIHVPISAVASLAAETQLVKDGARLRTWAGNRVAVYSSNNREGPTGAVAGTGNAWFYATGPVTMRRGPIRSFASLADSFNRSDNTARQTAERTYVISWDCCLLAAQVIL